jgi:hypothetical protein
MSQFVTIQSVTANTPVDIYYCNSGGGDCQFVASVATFPFSFYVPSPYSESTIVIKIEDTQGCIDEIPIDITPTPTPNVTKTPTMTPTPSYSPTLSPTQTPSMTPTNSPTTSNTATISSTPTATPLVVFHPTADSCSSPLNLTGYYTYISEANLVPVVGATIYQTLLNGVLYNPLNGGGNTYIISFGGTLYQVVIDSQGKIVSFSLCVPSTPTQTQTPSQTQTPTQSETPPQTPTQTETPSQTPTVTPSFVEFLLSYGATICGSEINWTSKTKEEVKCDFIEAFDPLVEVDGNAGYYYNSSTTLGPGSQLYYNLFGIFFVNTTLTGKYGPSTYPANPDISSPPLYVMEILNGVVVAITNFDDISSCGTYVCPCLCYYFENQDVVGSTIQYTLCDGSVVGEPLSAGSKVERCIRAGSGDFSGGVTSIQPCSSVTICTDSVDCGGCS